jgi:N-acetylneuraminate synthase
MLTRLQLGPAAHRKLRDHCRTRGIQFLSSAFDDESLDLLLHDLELPIIKLGSGELTNAPPLLRAARSGPRIILADQKGTDSARVSTPFAHSIASRLMSAFSVLPST